MHRPNKISLSLGRLIFTVLTCCALAVRVTARDLVADGQANVMVELSFTAAHDYADPFNEVTLDVVFTEPGGRALRVPAFWDGARSWKVRYASPLVGKHQLRSECSVVDDNGLHGVSGTVEIKPYGGGNPLYTHGPLKLNATQIGIATPAPGGIQ